MEKLKNEILSFINTNGTVNQSELVSSFILLTPSTAPAILNELIAAGLVEPVNRNGILFFKLTNKAKDYETIKKQLAKA